MDHRNPAHNIAIGEVDSSACAAGLASIFRGQPIEHACAGQTLFFEGDVAANVFAVVQGSLRICRLMADGRRVITGFMGSGDVVGVSFQSRYLYSAEAMGHVAFQRMTKRAFDEELEVSPQVRNEVFSRLRDEVAAAQDQMVLLSCKSAEERVCSFLLGRLKRARSADPACMTIDLAMTRLDIADYLGLTIETVSRTITKLVGKGIIATLGRAGIRVVNEAGLASHSGDGQDCDFGEYRAAS